VWEMGTTLGPANGWDLWDLWVGLISPIGLRSPECAPDAAMLIDRYQCPS